MADDGCCDLVGSTGNIFIEIVNTAVLNYPRNSSENYSSFFTNILGSYCDCKKSNYLSPFVTKAAHAVAHPFFDMKAILNLESLKFPWNCSLTSATAGEASDAIAFVLPDGSKVSDKYHELLNKAVTSMTGLALMKGLDNKGPRMDLLVHPMMMNVNLVGQSSMRDMKDISKYVKLKQLW